MKALGIAAGLLILGSAQASAFDTPDGAVWALYKTYGVDAAHPDAKVDCAKVDSKGLDFEAKTLGALFEPKLARALARDKDLGADPFIEGQDFCLTNMRVNVLKSEGASAKVEARFKNLDAARHLTFDLVKTDAGWRIANSHGADVKDMRKHYKLR